MASISHLRLLKRRDILANFNLKAVQSKLQLSMVITFKNIKMNVDPGE